MSHRKIRSQGYVPFSWEEKPGVPKFSHQKSSSDMGLKIISEDHLMSSSDQPKKNIAPPPPCTSRKSFSQNWKDDPFIAALKYCTNQRGHKELKHKGNDSKRKKTNVFSCKESCIVENDNFVKFSKLPPLPKERYSARSFINK